MTLNANVNPGASAEQSESIRPSPGAGAGPRWQRSRLVVSYALFAALSIAANIGAQKLSFWLYRGFGGVTLSVIAGTAVGLVVKYLLDKAWIFRYPHRDVAHGIRTFVLYTVMGLGTTVIFWAFEFGADALFHTEPARLTGGLIGLVLGYLAKYQLDRRFVFAPRSAGCRSEPESRER